MTELDKLDYLHVYREITGPYWCVAWPMDLLDRQQQYCLLDWCRENFGPGLGMLRVGPVQTSNFTHRWVDDVEWGELRFSQEADLNWFLLRWMNGERNVKS